MSEHYEPAAPRAAATWAEMVLDSGITARFAAEDWANAGLLASDQAFALVELDDVTWAAPYSDIAKDRPSWAMSAQDFAAYAESVEKEIDHFSAVVESGAFDDPDEWMD